LDKERANKTQKLSDILNGTVFSDKLKKTAFSRIAKQSTIFSFWDDIAGKKLSKITKPYQIKYSKLYISAKSPTVNQELSLIKNKLLEKINLYSKPLGIEIKELVLNYKNYDEITKEKNDYIEDKPVEYTLNQIDSVKIDGNFEQLIKTEIDKINFLNQEQKEKLVKKIIQSKKAEILRKNI